jgi:enolase
VKIKYLKARKVLATNAEETVEVELQTEKGNFFAAAPIGTSRGKYEVYYHKPEDALRKFQLFRRQFSGKEFSSLQEVDDRLKEIDGTTHFTEIGGNLALAISSAAAKAFAAKKNLELYEFFSEEFKTKAKIPLPIANVAGGWKGQSIIQEFLLLPTHQETFAKSIFKMATAYHEFGLALKQADPNFNFEKNIESAWLTKLHFEKVLHLLKKIANEYLLKIGLDFAASQFWDGTLYVYPHAEKFSSKEQAAFVMQIAKSFPVTYIEDPFHEDDYTEFATLTSELAPKIVCGDDLYCTRLKRAIFGIERKATSAIVIKPSQVGTISDAAETAKYAKTKGIITVVSHRSGETDDALLAHFAVGIGSDYAKLGIAGERILKLNEIIRIEEKLIKG